MGPSLPRYDWNQPVRRKWRRWQKAILCSLLWAAFIRGAFFLYADVLRYERPEPSEMRQLVQREAIADGIGVLAILLIIYSLERRED